ncbi:MAG: alpha-amylase, partial [Deltaproteobacteria bacterium]|nr:alpha-amylase [Deltaproteobacteria bacterium]
NFALYDFFCHDGSVDENVFAYSNRVEGQRALVLYNNRYGKTAGWLKTASSVAIKVDDDKTELRSISLDEALSVPDEQDSFLAFLDLSTGHEYLRNAADICRQGLFAELAEYEFHVFLDFRIVTDSGTGGWKRLCDHLSGCGVVSLEEELIQLEYQPLIASFAACLDRLGSLYSPPSLKAAVQDYCENVPPVVAAACAVGQQDLVKQLSAAHQLTVTVGTLRLLRLSGVTRAELPLTAENRRIALALLLTRQLALPLSDDALHEYGLGRSLATFVAVQCGSFGLGTVVVRFCWSASEAAV